MEEFRICPACGYGRGFHLFFKKAVDAVDIGLICPSCGQSYSLGWKSRDVPDVKAEKGPSFKESPKDQ